MGKTEIKIDPELLEQAAAVGLDVDLLVERALRLALQKADPAGAVNEIYRRGLTGGTGQVVPATDMTPFFRRDTELPALMAAVRRISSSMYRLSMCPMVCAVLSHPYIARV